MFRKAFISYAIAFCMLLSLYITPSLAISDWTGFDAVTVTKVAETTNVFELKAKASILMDSDSGRILLEKNSHDKLPIASVTKIMSMLLIMEAIDSGKLKYEEQVQVSESASNMGGSQVYLKQGESFTVNDMLKAVAVHSANDATVALAEKIAGAEVNFVAMMNEKARNLGMHDTNFLDCTGLTDEGHYSSAHDVGLMSRELLTNHPDITKYTKIWHDTFRNGEFSLDNTNKLVRFYEGTTGLKTGFTGKAGYNLSASTARNDLQLIAVVLGEADSNTRFGEARKLLDYGFANYEVTRVNNKSEIVQEIEVKRGLQSTVKAVYKKDVKLLLNKGEKSKVKREVRLEPGISAPVKIGQKVGMVIYTVDNKEVGTVDLVSDCGVDKASVIKVFCRLMVDWFSIGRAK